jgi:Ca-activated chloride channel homolog
MKAKSTLLAGLVFLLSAATAWGQGVLVVVNHPHPIPLPRPILPPQPTPPPMSYRIKELSVQGNINNQVARVQVTQSFVNTGSTAMEVCFVFPLPHDGAVDQLTFLVDGKEFEGKLLPADQARSIYEGYVRRNRDPALLEWVGYGMFKTSVFPVPPGAERKVTLRYNQLLRKQGKLVDFLFPMSTAKYTSQAVEKVSVNLRINSQDKIKSVYSPTHPINVSRSDDQNAVISWEVNNFIPTADFRLFYDTDPGKLSASLISYRPNADDDGYFLLLASPEIQAAGAETMKKTVMFVVDRSGSMSGKKIEQAKEALRFVLNNLREGDLFNIVAYDGDVEAFRPEVQRFDTETRAAALGFVDGLYAGGSTNIDQALNTALSMLQDDSRPTYIIFLSDGLPTAGEKNEARIVANAKERNKVKARMLSFGVGYDVNSRLLDRLVNENFGLGQYVRPDEDIEQHVSALYGRISAPVMVNVNVRIDVEGAGEASSLVNRVYPKHFTDLFAGEQLVLAGRYKQPGNAKIVIRGKVGDREQSFDFPATLVQHSMDQSLSFVEKLWAVRRIGEIIDELDLHGKNDELLKELVALSTQHGILTPYTSFMADENQRGDLADGRQLNRSAESRLSLLDESAGRGAFAQRAEKQSLRNATQPGFAGGGFGGAGIAADAFAPGGHPDAGAVFGAGAPAAARALQQYYGGVTFRDVNSDTAMLAEGVRNVGSQTLYKEGKRWIAANAREATQSDAATARPRAEVLEIERYSDDYFKLVSANTKDENSILAAQQSDEELLVRLRGRLYLIK